MCNDIPFGARHRQLRFSVLSPHQLEGRWFFPRDLQSRFYTVGFDFFTSFPNAWAFRLGLWLERFTSPEPISPTRPTFLGRVPGPYAVSVVPLD